MRPLRRMRLGAFARQHLQHAEQAEPPDECQLLDGRLPVAAADAGRPTLGRVEPAERDLDVHVDLVSLPTGRTEDITRMRDLPRRPRTGESLDRVMSPELRGITLGRKTDKRRRMG